MSNEKKFIDVDYPELAKLFKYQNQTHIGYLSSKKVTVVCPYCGREKDMNVSALTKLGRVTCPLCNDGFPYTEKLMSNILEQLGIDFYYHYQPDWAKPYIYDYMFLYNDVPMIIELDGGLGHGNKNNLSGLSVEQSSDIDRIKDRLALENGCEIHRIDCNYNNNRFEYLRGQYELFLSKMFDTSIIDWKTANSNALDSMFWKVIDCYENVSKYVDDISKQTGVSIRTTQKYLREAMEYGFLEKRRIRTNNPFAGIPSNTKIIDESYLYDVQSNPIICVDENIIFDSITTLSKYYGLERMNVSHAIRKRNGYYNFHWFRPLKDIEDDYVFEEKSIHLTEYNANVNSNKIIYQYDTNMKLVNIYYGTELLSQEYNIRTIYNAIYKRRCTAYGYIWSYNYYTK